MYKYKLKETSFKVGDSKEKDGIKSTISNLNPQTGAVTWDIEKTPAIDTTFRKFTELKNFIKKLDQDLDDPIITGIGTDILKLYNQYRTHIRKTYPDVYKRATNEISTSNGAGAYLTKYAFKLPKHYKKVQENIGATLGPGPKAGPEGVKDNYYVKKFKYKLVPKDKQGTHVQKGSGLEVKKIF